MKENRVKLSDVVFDFSIDRLKVAEGSLPRKLPLYNTCTPKEDRKFLDIYRIMSSDNFHLEVTGSDLENEIYEGKSEVNNFVDYMQYIVFFMGLPEDEQTLRNLLLIPSFIIFWNTDLEENKFDATRKEELTYDMCYEKQTNKYDEMLDICLERIKITNNKDKEKYKQTIKNMHLIYVKSMNSSYEDNPGRCLATKLKDQNGNLIDVSQTFSDFADMLCEEKLIDDNTRNRLKSGPNSFLLHLSTIWKYIKFFFRKNILRQRNIHYGYDSEILIEKINHFGNIFAPGWFNADSYRYAKEVWTLKHDSGTRLEKFKKDETPDSVYFSAYMYFYNRYFGGKNKNCVLSQMLINQAFNKSNNEESPNFKEKKIEEENNNKEEKPKEAINTEEIKSNNLKDQQDN